MDAGVGSAIVVSVVNGFLAVVFPAALSGVFSFGVLLVSAVGVVPYNSASFNLKYTFHGAYGSTKAMTSSTFATAFFTGKASIALFNPAKVLARLAALRRTVFRTSGRNPNIGWPPDNDALYRTMTAVWATREVSFGKMISWSDAGCGRTRRSVTFSIPVGENPWKMHVNSSSSCSKENSSWLKVRCSVMPVEKRSLVRTRLDLTR
jgi:hypothetical protein